MREFRTYTLNNALRYLSCQVEILLTCYIRSICIHKCNTNIENVTARFDIVLYVLTELSIIRCIIR